jgi:hypothetical protein
VGKIVMEDSYKVFLEQTLMTEKRIIDVPKIKIAYPKNYSLKPFDEQNVHTALKIAFCNFRKQRDFQALQTLCK